MAFCEITTLTPLRQINLKDERFKISFPSADEALLSSIRKLGIIHPVVLLGNNPSTLVTGFKRIDAAKKLGMKDVPAVTACLNEKEALFFVVMDNLHRGLNSVEKAHALACATRLDFSEQEVRELLEITHTGNNEKVRTMLLSLAGAETPLKHFVVGHSLSLKNIEYMLWFKPPERKKIIRALDSIKITESYIREILEMLHVLKTRKGRFTAGPLRATETAVQLHARLKKMVYPGLTSLEKKLAHIMKSVSLPPEMDIRVDPFFEKEYIDIGIRAKSESELKILLLKLHSIVENGHAGRILELTKGRIR